MKNKIFYSIALFSLGIIGLEMVWTRIFSAEFFYTFAFLVLSVAVLGLGLGALVLRLIPKLCNEEHIGRWMTITAILAVVSPILTFAIGLEFKEIFTDWTLIWKVAATIILLGSAFFTGGIALALLFRIHNKVMNRLYMFDLIGAGLGVLAVIWSMNQFGTPAAAFLVALPMLIAAVIMCHGWRKLGQLVLMIAVVALSPLASGLLEKERDEYAPVIYKHWDAMSKIKVFYYGDDARGINIDNVANTPVYAFDGDWAALDTTDIDWSINVSYLIRQFDSCTFLSLGAGGGGDVFQALVEGATEVHAVEVNPHINYMMVHGDPDGYWPPPPPKPDTTVIDSTVLDSTEVDTTATDSIETDTTTIDSTALAAEEEKDTTFVPVSMAEFTSHMYLDPRVKVVTEDARAYVRRFKNKFDVIYSLSSNSWAALASGAMALAENYIFTTEAFQDYWQALSDSGYMMMEHQVYMPRLVSEIKDALIACGVAHPEEHLAFYDLPSRRRNMVLISKQPLSDEVRRIAFGELTDENFEQLHLLYPPANDSLENNLIASILRDGWQAHADSAKVDISPVTDDRPFIAQMGLWRNFDSERMARLGGYADMYGFPISHVIILVILGVVVILVLPLNLLPFAFKGEKLRAVPWLYFFMIGIGFMAIEIALIHKYSLLIGASLYSIATILMTLLIFSGIGSRFSNSFKPGVVFGAIVILVLLDSLVMRHLIYAAAGWSLFPRMLLTMLLVAPMSFFLGMPFPKATARVGELVDWGFAVNGAASVLGSILVLILAFNCGFSFALVVAALVYLIAGLLFAFKNGWKLS